MPHFKCDACHHEWDGDRQWIVCDWCGFTGHILEKETSLERLIKKLFKGKGKK